MARSMSAARLCFTSSHQALLLPSGCRTQVERQKDAKQNGTSQKEIHSLFTHNSPRSALIVAAECGPNNSLRALAKLRAIPSSLIEIRARRERNCPVPARRAKDVFSPPPILCKPHYFKPFEMELRPALEYSPALSIPSISGTTLPGRKTVPGGSFKPCP